MSARAPGNREERWTGPAQALAAQGALSSVFSAGGSERVPFLSEKTTVESNLEAVSFLVPQFLGYSMLTQA